MSTRASTTAAARPSGRRERVQTTGTKPGTESGVPMATRGRRKLDFTSQRFRGKVFFLDLAGSKQAGKVEKELTQRGATVEKFFNRGVKYLITNRGKGAPPGSTTSPSTPSPQTPGSTPSSGAVPAHYTRAQRLIHMSNSGSGSKKVDLVSKAGEWGCKVVSLEELLAELRKLPPLPPSPSSQTKTAINGRQAKVRKLVAPFLKAEDVSRGYCPLVYEGKGAWPRPDVMCSPKGCPYDTPNKKTRPGHAPPVVAAMRASVTRPPAAESQTCPALPEPSLAREKRPGYCECCAVRYTDLAMHLRSNKHLEFATTDANFSNLDALIAQGTSFSDFISSHLANRSAETKKTVSPAKRLAESVILVTPPHSPRGKGRRALIRSPGGKPRKSPVKATPTSGQGKSPWKTTPRRGQQKSPAKTPSRGQGKSPAQTPTPTKAPGKSPAKTTPIKALGKSLSSGLGKSPSPSVVTPPNAKKIIRLEGDFVSPKLWELCITPVSPKLFASPFKGAKVNNIADLLSSKIFASTPTVPASASTPGAGTKRKLSPSLLVSNTTPPSKRQRRAQTVDVVPESPQKISKNLGRHSSPLCNLRTLLERSKRNDVQAGCARTSHVFSSPRVTAKKRSCDSLSSSPATTIRRSPRLVERSQKVKIETSKVKTFSTPPKDSLTVSLKLSQVYLRSKRLVTPEISLQGLPPSRQNTVSPYLSHVSKSLVSKTTTNGSSAWSFHGFNPDSVGRSVPQFAMTLRSSPAVAGSVDQTRTSDFSFSGFTPSSVQNARPPVAMTLRSSPKSGPCDEPSKEVEEERPSRGLRRTRLSFSSAGHSSQLRKPGCFSRAVCQRGPGSE